MDSQTRLGLELLTAALLLGLLGDLLLRTTPWGLNACLWSTALGLTAYGMTFRWRTSLARAGRWMVLPVTALALLYLGRDAPLLKLATTAALMAVLVLAAQRAQAARIRSHASIAQDPPGLLVVGARSLLGLPVFLSRGVDWRSLSAEERGRKAAAVGRGLLIALPALAVFGGLLVAADAAFEALVGRVFAFDVVNLPGHVILTAVFAWIVGGFLYGVLLHLDSKPANDEDATAEVPKRERRFALGFVEISVVLGLVTLLFATFIVVQLAYLFGGHATVLGTPDLTLATYARRGFFELVTVVALALPFLMGLRRLLVVRTVNDLRRFHGLARLHVGLLVLLLASAAQRMLLYQQEYGLTEMRLYVSAVLVWLAFVLGWFVWTVLRDRAERFVPGAVVAGVACVLGLHALNPDALIVRTNIARTAEGRTVDISYLSQLSADAVPALLDALPNLPDDERKTATLALRERWGDTAKARPDWRTWSRSRSVARRAVAALGVGGWGAESGGRTEKVLFLGARDDRRFVPRPPLPAFRPTNTYILTNRPSNAYACPASVAKVTVSSP